jgi:hypothetical protein
MQHQRRKTRVDTGSVTRRGRWLWLAAAFSVALAWLVGDATRNLQGGDVYSSVTIHAPSPWMLLPITWPTDVFSVALWLLPTVGAALLLAAKRPLLKWLGRLLFTGLLALMLGISLLLSWSDGWEISGGWHPSVQIGAWHALPYIAILLTGWIVTILRTRDHPASPTI